jgi:NADPH:quinone reductase-like Zn-dependent oxidoreductase
MVRVSGTNGAATNGASAATNGASAATNGASATSRKVVVTGKGGPEVLELVPFDVPAPRAGQVRLRVGVAGVAFGDVMRRRGVLAPLGRFTPGYDVAGTVEALGAGVDPTLHGKRAAVLMPTPGVGGYAEHVCVPAARLVRVPDGVDLVEALALGLNYVTAYQLLERLVPLPAGARVLVHGAAGGVGTALLDLGRRRGLVVYGTASAGKHELVRSYGATPIDYRSEDFVARVAELSGGAGVDAVFDPIGGAHLARSNQTLRAGGTLVSFGASGDLDRGLLGVLGGVGSYLRLKLRPDGRRRRLYMITLTRGTGWRHCRDDWAALLALRQRGEVHPLVGARIPFADVRRAHQLVDAAAVSGKVVLIT